VNRADNVPMARVVVFEVAASSRDELRSLGLEGAEDFLDASCGVIVKATRPGREVRRFGDEEHGYFVKRIRGPGWREIPHEHRVLRHLAERGLPVASPVALVVAPPDAALVTEALPVVGTLEDRVLGEGKTPPTRALIEEVASLVRRLHHAGVNHRDLYIGHLLLDADDHVWLVDLGRAEQRSRVPWRRIVKDLAALHFSTPDRVLSMRGRLRFLILYAQGWSGRRMRRLASAVRRKSERMLRHAQRRLSQGATNIHVNT
jgi:heptose I phosphotransferase